MKRSSKEQKGFFSGKARFIWLYVILGLAVRDGARRALYGNECGALKLFGIPCPSCGMTRAFLSLLRLDIVSAFRFNPAFPTFIAAVALLILSIVDEKRRRLYAILAVIDVILLITVWAVRLALG